MADLKISALPSATTPVAGTEVLPIVQSSTTKKVSINDLTAGRAVAASSFTGSGATVTTSSPVLSLSQTWNALAVAFTGVLFNATGTSDANSDDASLLLDLQLGSSSRFQVRKDGRINVAPASTTGGIITCGSNNFRTLQFLGANFGNNGTAAVRGTDNYIAVRGSGGFGWESAANNPATGTLDVLLARDAANVLALRNSTAAQTSRIYGSYTSASVYKRLSLSASTTAVTIAAETDTGNMDVIFTPAGTGNVQFGTHAAVTTETVTGYITIKDAGGTPRKLAVVS